MRTTTAHPRLDAMGIVFSALCVIHCLATPLIATGALAWVASESIHTGLTIVLSAIVLLVAWPSFKVHRNRMVLVLLGCGITLLIAAVVGESFGEQAETTLTVLGSISLVAGHVLNLHFRRNR